MIRASGISHYGLVSSGRMRPQESDAFLSRDMSESNGEPPQTRISCV